MAILRVRDKDGKVTNIPAIKGDKGDSPVKGKDYWTDADKEEIKSFISDEVGKIDVETPAFDLSALGLTAVPLGGGSSTLETDTTEIMAALGKGTAIFAIPVTLDIETVNVNFPVNATAFGGMYQAISIVGYNDKYIVEVVVGNGVISVTCSKMVDFVGVPAYVEEYISSALEGDY